MQAVMWAVCHAQLVTWLAYWPLKWIHTYMVRVLFSVLTPVTPFLPTMPTSCLVLWKMWKVALTLTPDLVRPTRRAVMTINRQTTHTTFHSEAIMWAVCHAQLVTWLTHWHADGKWHSALTVAGCKMCKIMKNDCNVMEFFYLFAEIINCGYKKITIFDHYLALPRNWCKIEP